MAMEKLSIEALRAGDDHFVEDFISEAITHSVNEDDLRTVIAELCCTNLKYPIPLPLPNICYDYLKIFFKMHYSCIVWKSLAELPIEAAGTFIRWSYENTTHCALLSDAQYNDLMATTPLLEFQDSSTEGENELKEEEKLLSKFSESSRLYIKWYLYHLRIREKDKETFDDYLREVVDVSPNSEILDINGNTARFNGALWADKIQEKSIILAGLGGIGRIW